MGLTIDYILTTTLTRVPDVRALVESIRQVALDLPFKQVGGLLEFKGKDADVEQAEKDDPHLRLKILAGQFVQDGNTSIPVPPLHTIGFYTWPGDGCPPATIGFSRYPPTVEVPRGKARTKRVRTNRAGWSGRGCCKTQYASDPNRGGVHNFLCCHLCVVKLLDFVQKTGLVTLDVIDDGGYWENRDLGELARKVADWNELFAAFAGMRMDMAEKDGIVVESAIADFANFEHLEAKGLACLERLRQQKKGDGDHSDG